MPTYEYICDACDHAFERFHSMSAAPIKKCPTCGKNKVTRKIGMGAGIIFKGGGFYETDYRGDSYQKAADADKAPSSDAKSDGNSDATPETKAEAKVDAKSDKQADAKREAPKTETKVDTAPAKTESKPASKPAKKK
jgi:putative FmdB family regulatory protein